METCCLKRFSEVRDHIDMDRTAVGEEEEEQFPAGQTGRTMRRVWDLFEKPHTSVGARG